VSIHPISARLLGTPEFRSQDGSLLPVTPKLAALIAYLDVRYPAMAPRMELADLLWERMFERQARQNLRKAMDRLRRLLGADILVTRGELVGLNVAHYDSDTLALDRLQKDVSASDAEVLISIGSAEFLSGIDLVGERWAAWLSAERHRRQEDLVRVLSQAAQMQADKGEVRRALGLAGHAIAANPFAEEPRRIRMKALAETGRSTEAIQEYNRFAGFLRKELNVAPSGDTQSLLETVSGNPAPTSVPVNGVQAKGPALSSLAVMPIRVLGSARRGAELAAGLELEIVTTLAKLSTLAIVDLSPLGRVENNDVRDDLAAHGADAVLKSGLQVVGDRVRLSAQLIATATNRQIWADRFDRRLTDILEIEESLTKDIVTQLQVRLTEGEQARIWSAGTAGFKAWQAIVRATHLIHAHQKDGVREARRLAQRAVGMDPAYASAYAAVGWTHWVEGRWFWSEDQGASFERARGFARKALALDAVNPDARTLHGVILVHLGHFDQALEEMEQAVGLAPSHAHIAALAAYVHRYAGDPKRAIDLIDRAMRLSPGHPLWYLNTKAAALCTIGATGEAEEALRDAHSRDPELPLTLALLASILGQTGKREKGGAVVQELLRLEPGFSTARWCAQNPYRDDAVLAREKAGLLAVGAPP